jgi:hypothetical protein
MTARLLRFANSRTAIGQPLTDSATYRWFNTLARPKHLEEYRGVYKYDATLAPTTFQPDIGAIRFNIEAKYQLDLQATFNSI